MNFSLNARLSHVTKQSWEELTKQLGLVYQSFLIGYYPEIEVKDEKAHLKVKRNLLHETLPFYEIILDRGADRVIFQSSHTPLTYTKHNGLIGCFLSNDFANILEQCTVKDHNYILVSEQLSVYIHCTQDEFQNFNIAVYGTDTYLTKVWEANRVKCASDLAYELSMHPDSSFEEFIGRREVKYVTIKEYLPSLEVKYPGLINELKEWHSRILDRKLLDQERYMRTSLMELCYLTQKPQILALLGDGWVERELKRAVDVAESNDFRITRGVLPVEEIANRFDALIEERKKWLETHNSNYDVAMEST